MGSQYHSLRCEQNVFPVFMIKKICQYMFIGAFTKGVTTTHGFGGADDGEQKQQTITVTS